MLWRADKQGHEAAGLKLPFSAKSAIPGFLFYVVCPAVQGFTGSLPHAYKSRL